MGREAAGARVRPASGRSSSAAVHARRSRRPAPVASRAPCVPPPLLAQGEADATWVFMGWEGVEAQRRGVELNAFK